MLCTKSFKVVWKRGLDPPLRKKFYEGLASSLCDGAYFQSWVKLQESPLAFQNFAILLGSTIGCTHETHHLKFQPIYSRIATSKVNLAHPFSYSNLERWFSVTSHHSLSMVSETWMALCISSQTHVLAHLPGVGCQDFTHTLDFVVGLNYMQVTMNLHSN